MNKQPRTIYLCKEYGGFYNLLSFMTSDEANEKNKRLGTKNYVLYAVVVPVHKRIDGVTLYVDPIDGRPFRVDKNEISIAMYTTCIVAPEL